MPLTTAGKAKVAAGAALATLLLLYVFVPQHAVSTELAKQAASLGRALGLRRSEQGDDTQNEYKQRNLGADIAWNSRDHAPRISQGAKAKDEPKRHMPRSGAKAVARKEERFVKVGAVPATSLSKAYGGGFDNEDFDSSGFSALDGIKIMRYGDGQAQTTGGPTNTMYKSNLGEGNDSADDVTLQDIYGAAYDASSRPKTITDLDIMAASSGPGLPQVVSYRNQSDLLRGQPETIKRAQTDSMMPLSL